MDSAVPGGAVLRLSSTVALPLDQIGVTPIRAQGAGGQNVNKVANAAHLRFDIGASTLPDDWKARLRGLADQRVTRDGIIVIKAQQYRSLEKNREAALERLRLLILRAVTPRPPRTATRPSATAKARRLDDKIQRGRLKALRGRVTD